MTGKPTIQTEWSLDITPRRGLLDIQAKEIWRYRDLLYLFVKRDIVSFYKQTVLGPLWLVIQPILTTLVFTVVFGNIAGISTDGLPKMLFYLAGVTIWSYFAECFTKTSSTFVDNADLFGKVYFPRMITPLAIVFSNLIKFSVQFGTFLLFLIYYWWQGLVQPNLATLLLPLLLILMASISLGLGLIFSAMTTKYRDLRFLLQFGVQLFMYATPVIYPVSTIPEKYVPFIQANPLTSIVETFRYAFLGTGSISYGGIMYACVFSIVILILGVIIFNRVEATFVDTV
jgi:lipopolysaccharide transport system permease protein